MASIIKVDRILDSTELGKVDIPGGIETDVLNATELVANTWKNVDGTENYKCKCWVNFDGTTTPPTIRASGNVSSVVRNATGDFTVNFETPMEDANYSMFGLSNTTQDWPLRFGGLTAGAIKTNSAVSVRTSFGPASTQGAAQNQTNTNVLIFR